MRLKRVTRGIAALAGTLACIGTACAGVSFSNKQATQVPSTGSGLAGAYLPIADTLVVSPHHIGHLLVAPYFSTQDGNVSLLNIINTDTVNGKVLRVRYRGAANSDALFSFSLYLAPGDVWAGEVSQSGGQSRLQTNDLSCTLPASVNLPFNTDRVQGQGAQTLEGYVEIINMTDIPPHEASAGGTGSLLPGNANALFNAISHTAGTPDCANISSIESMNPTNPNVPFPNSWEDRGYNFPTGGLMAHWSIVNLSKAGSFTGAATAIAARKSGSTSDRAVANLVYSAPTDAPQYDGDDAAALAAGRHPSQLTADPLLAGGTLADGSAASPAIMALNLDFPDLSTPYVTPASNLGNAIRQAELISDLLATKAVTNEYMTSPAVSFATDWTLSQPTRRYNVALDYKANKAVFAKALDYTQGLPPRIPAAYVSPAGSYYTPANVRTGANGLLCVDSSGAYAWDTAQRNNGPLFSPVPPNQRMDLCGEVAVVTFNNSQALGAQLTLQNFVPKSTSSEVFTDGWVRLGLNGKGLPITGHAFAKALGTSVNLGGIWVHSTDKSGL
ncbi:hypothetical protein [Comamonas flocculans]|uniref:Cell surface protein n=1 Tax=Comamonas flocculans TaxID=2597701 RepID=A0A5B8RUM2_9BURK|nr:hypothetical protein [Comamonas flocculans]QEA13246.1 hypothetical protein FOZ74_09510 [Comamonas flocculans]